MKVDPDYAVSYVDWEDATEFCKTLSAKEGKTYRLPTEAEWEYACRAGTTSRYPFGDDESQLWEYAEYYREVGERYSLRVGQKKPNPWGLKGMHGNVWEWPTDFRWRYSMEIASHESRAKKSVAIIPIGF